MNIKQFVIFISLTFFTLLSFAQQEKETKIDNIYFNKENTKVDFDWKIGDKWNFEVSYYPIWGGIPDRPGVSRKSIEARWNTKKHKVWFKYIAIAEVKDTVEYNGKNCWVVEFSGIVPDSLKQSIPFKTTIEDITTSKHTIWLEKYTGNQIYAETTRPQEAKWKLTPCKIKDYFLIGQPQYYPSVFIQNFLSTDSLITNVHDSCRGYFGQLEFKSQNIENKKVLARRVVQKEMKEDSPLSTDTLPGYHRGYKIVWEPNKNWWTSYEQIQDGHVQLRAKLIEDNNN